MTQIDSIIISIRVHYSMYISSLHVTRIAVAIAPLGVPLLMNEFQHGPPYRPPML